MRENDEIIKARQLKTYLLHENGKDIYSRPHLFVVSLIGGMKATAEARRNAFLCLTTSNMGCLEFAYAVRPHRTVLMVFV